MPIIGIVASSGILFKTSSYFSLGTATVTGGSASDVTFSNIPSNFQHLEIRYSVLCTSATDTYCQYNGDTTTNYRWHGLQTNGVSTYSYTGTGSGGYIAPVVASPSPACGIIQIMDYANTNKYKTLKGLVNSDNNGGGYATLGSHMWLSTAAISTIKFYAGQNLLVGSKVSLYGIAG